RSSAFSSCSPLPAFDLMPRSPRGGASDLSCASHRYNLGFKPKWKAMGMFRSISCSGIVAFAISLAYPSLATAGDAPITIVDLGDSYIIGHTIAAGETFPVRLQAALDAAGRSVKVVDTGFIESSRVGLRWL